MVKQHTHTVIALYIGILTIRLITSGRLQNAWEALRNGSPKTPTPMPTPKPSSETMKPAVKVG